MLSWVERVCIRVVVKRGRVEVRDWVRVVRAWEIAAGRSVGCGGGGGGWSVSVVARAIVRRVECWCWRWVERRGVMVGRLDWKAAISGARTECASSLRFMRGASKR